MNPYDSDSSGIDDDEAGDFTETNVLLGYADEDASDDSISHLGGWPVRKFSFLLSICVLFYFKISLRPLKAD